MSLLTIIVPTYKRARHLELLLRVLRQEISALASEVQVIVTDNASPDRTPAVTAAAQAAWPALIVQRHLRNLGPDENFCSAIDRVTSSYFWIISDDDMPKSGVIARVVDLLKAARPALLYMESEWLNPVTGPDQGIPVDRLHFDTLEAVAFASQVHVWTTFTSAMVVNRDLMLRQLGTQTIRRFHDTNLVQLGWVLPLLADNANFIHVYDRCVLATKDNSGGYPMLTVFGARFARIATEVFGARSRLARTMVQRNIAHYLPGILWSQRRTPSATHTAEDPWPAMRAELGSYALFWLMLWPMGRLPIWLAQPFYQAWRVADRISRELAKRHRRVAFAASRQP